MDGLNQLLTIAQDTPAATPEASGPSGFAVFLVIVAIFVVPLGLGALIAKALKLKDLGMRIGVVLLTIVAGTAPFVYRIATGEPELSMFERAKQAIPLGIDLAGGTNLVFQVDSEAAEAAGKDVSASMDRMVGAISRRINPSGTEEVTVRQVGADRIEVIIPGEDPEVVEQKKRLMVKLGSLEFEILANSRDHDVLIREGQQLPNTEDQLFQGTRVAAMWRDVTDENFDMYGTVAARVVPRSDPETDEEFEVTQVLTLVTPETERVTGKYLTSARQIIDENGSLAVAFTFNTRGAFLFQTLTGDNRPDPNDGFKRRLAILLDGKIESAPNINDVISSNGQISGDFTQAEIDELINVLNAGALEIPILPNPISENTISPLLGADVQDKGKTAIMIGAITVLVFMAVYYMIAGLIADLCLVVNLILVLGTMALIQATFTLPGLAGLVLTIGMAVDANVLIFERIREESKRGSSLRMAIQNGFGRAFSTIVDANVTTLIVAVVLYMIGTDQVKGFAVTLFIGILTSMYAALYVGRLIFDICERKRWIRELKMLSIVGATKFDFIGKRKIAFVVSLALIAAGMASLYSRGEDNLDIDFRGGTMVTFEFEEPQELAPTREALEAQFGSGITLERLTLSGEEQDASAATKYRLRTTDDDTEHVRELVATAFSDAGHKLRRLTVQFGEIETVVADTSSDPEGVDAEEEVDTATSADPYAGGNSVMLTFNEAVIPATVIEEFSQALSRIEDNGNAKYPEPESLFAVTGAGEVERKGDTNQYRTVELKARPIVDSGDLEIALDDMQASLESTPNFEEVNSFASSVADEMKGSAILAMLFSLIAIVAYIWFRFQRITFGFAAVAALVHDVLVVLGSVAIASYLSETALGPALALVDFKINLPMIAAFLTIVGYSLNDTIVVFDRIREVRGKNPALTEEMVNTSLNQTLGRTLLTSLTTLIVVLVLYALGGEGIHGFAFCLCVGVVVGTYSSIYVASPVLLWLMNRPGSETANATARAEKSKAAAAS